MAHSTRPARRRSGSVRPLFLLFLGIIVIAVVVVRLQEQSRLTSSERAAQSAGCSQVGPAFRAHQSGVWLALSGTVTGLLSDTDGAREHQRFVVGCADGQTVLIVNDVSIGQRAPVHVGDRVTVRGQYIWNSEGGLIHFTHHAVGSSQGGWILLGGRLYSLATPALF